MKNLRESLRHLFVPGHHNNHHAHVISHAALTAYLILAAASFVVLRNLDIQTGYVLGFATDVSIDRLLVLTNEQRAASGLPALQYSDQLATAAQNKANDMLSKGYWSHFGPNGESPWGFILATGYQYEYAGENLAKNFMNSEGVVSGWMNSETHRNNILSTNYTDVGFAVVNGNLEGEDTTLVVQMFGSRSKSPAQKVVSKPNPTDSPDAPPALPTKVLVAAKSQTATPIPPTATPSPVPEATPGVAAVVTQTNQSRPVSLSLNLYPAFRIIVLALVGFLIVAFVIDYYHLSKIGTMHHRGKHLAHIIFLLAVFAAVFLIGRGSIL
jgi:uncharacterized protein YkwD